MKKKEVKSVAWKCRFCKKNDEFSCDVFDDADNCWYSSYSDCRDALRIRNLKP